MPERRLLADLTPLRESPAFRRLWIGSSVSVIGSMMTSFAVALQVYRMTGSSAAVGGVGLATAVPALAFGLFGGALGDSVDRRRLVLVMQTGLIVVAAGFAAQSVAGNTHVWLLYLLVALESLLASFSGPARRTFTPRVVRAQQIPAASALTMLSMHLSILIGPLLAGLIVPVTGLTGCYVVDAASFVAGMYGVFRLPPMRPESQLTPGLQAVTAGLRFLARSRVLTGVLLADVSATLFAMPVALFPAINAERFGGSPRTLGLLSAGLAIGGIVGTVFSGPLGRLRRPGLGVLVAGGLWGACLAGFGLAHSLAATMTLLILAGIADVSSVVLRSTIIQLATPDELRSRINAAEIMVGAGMPQIGNFRAGAVAQLSSTTISATSGGLLAAAGALAIGLLFPALARYRPDVSAGQPARR